MGNAGSMNQHTDPRGHHMPLKLPMPEPAELEGRFALVLNSMNLPPDKARLLRQYDNEKKWELICDQERFQVKNPPHTYIHKVQSYLDPAVTRKKFRRRVQESTQVLRELEISLRTNHIGWVREFLNEENKGLDVLVEYLSFAQYAVTYDGDSSENSTENSVDKSKPWNRSIEDLHGGNNLSSAVTGNSISRASRHSTIRSNTLPSRRTLKNSRLVCKKDDVHVCIMCLRAIMNYQVKHTHQTFEFILVKTSRRAFQAVCKVCSEDQRFEKLMEHFKNEDNNIDFMVWVRPLLTKEMHMMYQFEFKTQLYRNNVPLSLEVCKDASSQVHTLRRMVKEKDETIQKQCNLEKKIHELEKQGTIKIQKKADGDIAILTSPPEGSGPLPGSQGVAGVSGEGAAHGLTMPEPPPPPMPETCDVTEPAFSFFLLCFPVPNGPSAPPPPPPPLPAVDISVPMPPPPPPMAPPLPGCGSPTVIMNSGLAAVKIKKPIKTKFRMPVFNWVALKPNQINGTVFNEIDDERILEDLNVDEFEEMFKTKAQGPAVDITSSKQKTSQKGPTKVSLLDSNRAKNLAITLRKVGKTSEEICRAIQMLDLRTLPVDFVECLMRFIPTEAELKVFRQYEKERKPLENLTDEDRFMVHFSKIERLMQKMTILAFVGNFTESVQMLTPQLHAVIAASVSIKSSQKLKKILEIILALGNYMNSSKRGAVYGFKLQSLDLLLDTKSTDRKITLLHYIANVVKDKYQQVSLFYNELNYVEKAAAVSLENVLLDVKELQRGMDLTRREYSMHGHNTLLRDFIQQHENKLKKLQDDAKIAQDAFDEVVKFFGENSKTTPPSVFFPVFVRFVKAYRQAEEDNEQRKRQEQMMMEKLIEQEAMMAQEDQKSPSHKSKRQQQELIVELRKKQVKDSRHVYEGKDGAIEDIITDLRNQPYRRADAIRRSIRRRFDDQNLRPMNNAEMVM
uniref:Formin-like protein 2 n=1 Tax=Sinocyclocheilus rhinocerous TaxID=307959 RepID=A0A673LSW5_9TELE